MISLLLAASVLAVGQIRLFAGSAAEWCPFAAAAWTALVARRSARGSFAGVAVAGGLLEGVALDAPWAAAVFACLVVGLVARATRRLLPVRRPRGEAALGILWAALATAVVDAQRPAGASAFVDGGAWLRGLVGVLATGAFAGAAALAADRAPALRAALARR